MTSESADISWKVHLSNKKASWDNFHGFYEKSKGKRNSDISDRETLKNDPGPREISGKNQTGDKFKFDTGNCYNLSIPLGEVPHR